MEKQVNREPQSIGVLEFLLPSDAVPPTSDTVTTWTKCAFIATHKRRGVMPHILSKLLSDRRAVKKKMKSSNISGRERESSQNIALIFNMYTLQIENCICLKKITFKFPKKNS